MTSRGPVFIDFVAVGAIGPDIILRNSAENTDIFCNMQLDLSFLVCLVYITSCCGFHTFHGIVDGTRAPIRAINHLIMAEPVKIYCQVHDNDVIMGTMASKIFSLTINYSIVYPVADKKKTSKLRIAGFCEGK